jgi:two-component system, NarL family, sensor kinase
MQIQAENIITLVVSLTLIFLVAGFFLITYVNLYNEKKRKHLEEKQSLKREFEQTLLQSQLEIKEQILHHIGYELHDNLGQVASLIKINLNTLRIDEKEKAQEKIENTKELIRQLIIDIKSLSVSLNSSDRILHSGLSGALQHDITRINKTGQFTASYTGPDREPVLNGNTAIILYRMAQEILNNILKHSGGNEINLSFSATENLIRLAIVDNGKGFDVEEKMNNGGAGLLNLHNRARLIQSTLQIESNVGKGTNITIELPI